MSAYTALMDFLDAPNEPPRAETKKGDIVDPYHGFAARLMKVKGRTGASAGARSTDADSSAPVEGRTGAGEDKSWDESYRELKAFHAKFGNCHVPYGREYGPLRYWAECQKRLQRSNGLEQDKLDKLKELDFPF